MNRIRACATLGLLAVLGASPLHAAAPLTWSWVEASYLSSDDSKGSLDGSGFRLGTSISFLQWLNFRGEHDVRDTYGADLSYSSAGLSVHSLRRNYQVYGGAAYEISNAKGVSDLDGYSVFVGARVPWRDFEAQAEYKYLDFGEDTQGGALDDARYRVSLQYRFSQFTSGLATWQTQEDSGLDEWTVGLRYYFTTQYDVRKKKKKK